MKENTEIFVVGRTSNWSRIIKLGPNEKGANNNRW